MQIGAYAAPRLDGEAEVAEVVSELKALGISEIYLLAKQCSLMTYPSQIAPCVPEAKEWDPFGALAGAASEAGIKVHAWFKLFPELVNQPSPILQEHPEILLVNRDGKSNLEEPTWQSAGQPIYWVCPSSELYRSYLCDLMREVLTAYPVTGIQLDFVRYPEEVQGRRYCYCQTCQNRFKEEYGYSLPSDSVVHNRYYVTILCENVVRSVEAFAGVTQEFDATLSAYVFTDYTTAIEAVCQDWPYFSKRVDRLHPTLYEVAPSHAGRLIRRARRVADPQCQIFPVISPVDHIWRGQMGGERWTGKTDAAYLLETMDAVLQASADGIWLYLYEALSHRPSYDFSPRYSLPQEERALLQAGMRERGWR